jgi:hypothetical protein
MPASSLDLIKYIMHYPYFSQALIVKESGFSMVKVTNMFEKLESRGFIGKEDGISGPYTSDPDTMRYKITNPPGLLKSIALTRDLKSNLIFESEVDMLKSNVMTYLRATKAVFCLDTALEKYWQGFIGDAVCCYIESPSLITPLRKYFTASSEGITQVRLYRWDPGLDLHNKLNSFKGYTTELQTMIDLYCDGRSELAEKLIDKRWPKAE